MDAYRRSRSQGRIPSQTSPPYRDYDASGYDYFDRAAAERSRRSRSLDNRRELRIEEYGMDPDGDRWQQRPSRRTYEYQPYLNVSTQFANEQHPRSYMEDVYLDQLSPDVRHRSQHYSPRAVGGEGEWGALDRSIRNYRDDSATLPIRQQQHLPPSKFLALTPRSGGQAPKKPALTSGIFSEEHQRNKRTAVALTPRVNESYTYKAESGGGRSVPMFGGYDDGRVTPGGPGGTGGYSHQRTHRHESRSYGGGNAMPSGGGSGAAIQYQGGGSVPPAAAANRRLFAKSYGPDEHRYYKVHCCCVSFRWPPWRYEEVEPPQPMYRHQ